MRCGIVPIDTQGSWLQFKLLIHHLRWCMEGLAALEVREKIEKKSFKNQTSNPYLTKKESSWKIKVNYKVVHKNIPYNLAWFFFVPGQKNFQLFFSLSHSIESIKYSACP
jgi:hypothetical protein